MKRLLLAVSFSIILLLGSAGLNNANAVDVTSVSLDRPAEKYFAVTQGDTLIFTGRLVKASTVEGIANATVTIVHQVSFGQTTLLASGRTDANGFYSIPWVVDVKLVIGKAGGSSGTENTQASGGSSKGGRENRFQVVVVASFDGNDRYVRSVSNAQSFEVRLNALTIKLERKATYLAFESVAVKIMVKDTNGRLVDPDKITSRFDNNPVTLLKQSTGTYIFSVESLSPGNHQLQLLVEKSGHTPDDELISFDAMKRKTSLDIATDKSSYQLGEKVSITASLIDQSMHELVTDRVATGALTSPNLVVRQLTFVDGKASYTLEKTDATGKWLVSAGFAGDGSYFGAASQISFTVTPASVVAQPTPAKETVSLSKPTLVDQSGKRLKEVTVGQQVMIQSKITSNFATTEEIAYISQVKDAEGITVALSWITSTLAPGQALELAVSWTPETPGEYTTEVFVWKSIKNPEPLSSEIKSSTITVS